MLLTKRRKQLEHSIDEGPDTAEFEAQIGRLAAEVQELSVDVSLQTFAREAL